MGLPISFILNIEYNDSSKQLFNNEAISTDHFGTFRVFPRAFSKTGTDDFYLYKGTVLYKDGNGFIANVQKNLDSISVLPKYSVLFLRVTREKENKSDQTVTVNSGLQTKITDMIIRHVTRFQIDTLSYGKTKEYTKQGQSLQGSSLAYFLERGDSLRVGETFYFNSYGIVKSNPLIEELGMPVLSITRDFPFLDEVTDGEDEEEEDISIVETGDIKLSL